MSFPPVPHVPRGIANFNPGNIRRVETVVWKGQEQTQTDASFVQFVTPEYGIRAICRILTSYKRDGLNTIREAINRWAPPVENNTTAYIDSVCHSCNLGPDDVVDFTTVMPILIRAIIFHENGQDPYTDDQIRKGISLANT